MLSKQRKKNWRHRPRKYTRPSSLYSIYKRLYISRKISSGIGAIKKAKEFAEQNTLVLIYNALVQPHFDYCWEVWDVLGKTLSDRLQKLQNRAARIIMNFKNESGQSLLARNSLGWINLEANNK